jgi:membrane carboxypeptidase/penicillin-binding protein
MQFALTEHPDWADWDMPAGVEAVEINPKSGELTAPGDTEKRTEYFINGTDQITSAPKQMAKPAV